MDTQGSLTPTPALFEADQQPDAKRDRETGDQPLEVLGRVHVQTVLGATIAPLGNDYQRSTGSPWLQQRKIHHLPKSRGSRIASTLTDVSFLEGLSAANISLSAARCSTSRCGSCARKRRSASGGASRRMRGRGPQFAAVSSQARAAVNSQIEVAPTRRFVTFCHPLKTARSATPIRSESLLGVSHSLKTG
jgi:hypothetical protein